MSRRFGRNQRRKMREQLAAAQASAQWHESRANYFSDELFNAQRRYDQLENVARAWLGPNHPAFPAGKFDPGFKPEPEDSLLLLDGNGHPVPATVMRFGTPRLYEERRAVHYMLYAGKERFGYAISEHMLRNRHVHRDALARSIADELVQLLLDQMQKEPR
ncbi:hypothetical protein [Klebsiella pneumoniae]|uniref:hypothetical protein n=1 Tax=Klebsiella pneumoniae TaxID=573 RepID=UPI000D656646|nr:hypothetical protein [Klebsiella pneumoniae]